jgi:hypothetical protein
LISIRIERQRSREEKREEQFGFERRRENKMKHCLMCPKSFILGFTDGIPDEKLNIIVFKYSINDSVY